MTTPNTKPKTPRYVVALRLIGKADLKAAEKNVLRAMLEWVDFRDGSGLLWPAVGTLAAQLSMTASGVRGIIKRLVARGVLSVEYRSTGGGRTNCWKMHFGTIRDLQPGRETPNAVGGSGAPASPNADEGALNLESEEPSPDAQNPQPPEGEPSIHPPTEPSKKPMRSAKSGAGDFLGEGGWLDGSDANAGSIREVLAACGIRGGNLNILAGCASLTPEIIRAEWATIRTDKGVRNPPAVLAKHLADLAGITLPRRGTVSAAMSRLQIMRDNHRRGSGF